MINHLKKLLADFLKRYHSEGASVLINCHLITEFQKLVEAVKEMTHEHFGLNKSTYDEFFKKDTVSYLKILETPEISVGVFCMAQGT